MLEPAASTRASGTATVHRLAIAGFVGRAEAQRVCDRIKAGHGACFVRLAAGDQPIQWNTSGQTRLAMR